MLPSLLSTSTSTSSRRLPNPCSTIALSMSNFFTFCPPLPSFPSLNSPSIPFSFTLPPTTLSSQAYSSASSQPSSSRLPRGPNPRTSRRQQHEQGHAARHRGRGEGNGVRSRALGAGGAGGARTGTSGLERALVGRLGWGMDLSREERDLSEDEEEEREKDREIREFGNSFLIPFGCSKTRDEVQAIQSRSPSPSPPANAEDLQNGGLPNNAFNPPGGFDDTGMGADPEDQVRDLDESLEDLDENDSTID